MNKAPQSVDSADTSRLFREHDHLGADSSLFLRATRLLIQEGKPLGQITVLAFPSPQHGSLPFGALTLTKKNRIVFWPVVPRNTPMIARAGQITVFDHLTLELPNEKIHATAYDASGKPVRYAASDFGHTQSWRLQHFNGSGLAFWFSILVRWSVLRDQDLAVQRRLCMPTTDAERRNMEFTRLPNQIKVMDVPLQARKSAGDYVYCIAYLVTEPSRDIELSSDVLSFGNIGDHVDGYSMTSGLEVRALKLRYAHNQFVFATACPPGQLKQDVIVGFPRDRLDGPGAA